MNWLGSFFSLYACKCAVKQLNTKNVCTSVSLDKCIYDVLLVSLF